MPWAHILVFWWPNYSDKNDMTPTFDFFYTANRQEWRQWLADNHDKSPGIFFVFYKKKTGHPTLTYGEAVEDALC